VKISVVTEDLVLLYKYLPQPSNAQRLACVQLKTIFPVLTPSALTKKQPTLQSRWRHLLHKFMPSEAARHPLTAAGLVSVYQIFSQKHALL